MFLTDLFTRCDFFPPDITRYILQMQHVHESDHIIGNKTLKIRLCKKKNSFALYVKICTRINTDEINCTFIFLVWSALGPDRAVCIILRRVVNN